MSGLVVKHLKSSGVREIRIANRTAGRAAALAERVGGVEVSFDSLARSYRG
jgi:glutamyl-tRNA reductase